MVPAISASGRSPCAQGGLPVGLGSESRPAAEAACAQWQANIPAEWAATFKDLASAVRNWHDAIFAYFEQPITNASTESSNRVAKDMNHMDRGYSFKVLRARMLYDKKARKDGAVVETVLVDDDGLMTTNFEFQRMTNDGNAQEEDYVLGRIWPLYSDVGAITQSGAF